MRYSRQIAISQIGVAGQEKLQRAKVVVIGAGGIGSYVLTQLVEAGVGNLRIVDYDIVSESNLNRQFLYHENDIGKLKINIAKERLTQINSTINIEAVMKRVDRDNINDIIADYEIVVDCVDNIETRMLVNDACLENNLILVEAGVKGFYGFVTSIKKDVACLSCIGYQNTSEETNIPAISSSVGLVASFQALEVIKIIIGSKDVLFGYLLSIDGLDNSVDKIRIQKSHQCLKHG